MSASETSRQPTRSVLHVLPHPGGGGETHVDALAAMIGYRFNRAFLAPDAGSRGAHIAVARSALRAQRAARTCTILHVHGEVASMLCLPSLAARPSIVTLHGLHLLRRSAGGRRAAARVNLGLIVRAATRTICVSRAEHDELVDAVGAHAARRTLVIHNGVAPMPPPSPSDRAAIRFELGIPSTTTVGVSVGSLDAHKDPLTPVRAALDVAQAGADLAFVVVGDGPLRSQVEQAACVGAGRTVHVLGYRSDVRSILAAADFFVLASQREGFSYALLEAMSLGLPAVVSDAAGNPEAVGDTGIIVPYGDVAGFAAGFARLASDAQHRHALGARARERVTHCYQIDDMARRTRQAYDDIVKESLGRR